MEPFFASSGALASLLKPELLRAATPNALKEIPASLYPLFVAQAGSWFTLVFLDLGILTFSPYSRDPQIWKLLLTGGLVSDAFYLSSLWIDLGSRMFFDFRQWDFDIGFTMVTTLIPMAAKVCAALGVGLSVNSTKGKGKKD